MKKLQFNLLFSITTELTLQSYDFHSKENVKNCAKRF